MQSVDLLVVEDSPADVDLVEEVLTEFENNIELHVTRNGVEALGFIRDEEQDFPDLILLDLDLPQMNGFEFLDELKGDPDFKHLPVCVLTMSNAEEDILKAYRRGANSCLTKPLGFEEFNQIMQSVNSFWFETVNLPPK